MSDPSQFSSIPLGSLTKHENQPIVVRPASTRSPLFQTASSSSRVRTRRHIPVTQLRPPQARYRETPRNNSQRPQDLESGNDDETTPNAPKRSLWIRRESELSADAFSSEPIGKRQKLIEESVSLRDLPADEFLKYIKLFSGPLSTVVVEQKEFQVPKELLCYGSSFFRAALEGEFVESIEQKVTLEDFRAETFQMIIQWMYLGRMVLPSHASRQPHPKPNAKIQTPTTDAEPPSMLSMNKVFVRTPSTASASEDPNSTMEEDGSLAISRYLEFLELAHYLDLTGPFQSVYHEIKALLVMDRDSLKARHIHLSMKLPSGESARRVIVQATVMPFIQTLLDQSSTRFKFQAELDDPSDFGSDLIRECQQAFKTMKGHGRMKLRFLDPLARSYIDVEQKP